MLNEFDLLCTDESVNPAHRWGRAGSFCRAAALQVKWQAEVAGITEVERTARLEEVGYWVLQGQDCVKKQTAANVLERRRELQEREVAAREARLKAAMESTQPQEPE